jgi:hypothetical protein
MDPKERVPIEQALPGFTLHPLDEGWTPLQAFVLVKALDEAGQTRWSMHTSELLNMEELLGALTVQVDLLRDRLMEDWDPDDEDD